MNNFDLKKYLAEGKLLKEENKPEPKFKIGDKVTTTPQAGLDEGLFDFLKKKKEEAPKPSNGSNYAIGVDYDGNYIYADDINEEKNLSVDFKRNHK